jgi:4-amino-4-deoxy-L-arabinose transferase-like glycosyltransferase
MVNQANDRWWYGLIFLTSLFTLFVHNGTLGFWDQDESAYAGFALHFLESGNWLIPDFLWSDVHRKPPLHFWYIALSFKVFGANEFATRVPSVLAIVGTLLLVRFMSVPLFGKEVSKKAMLVLSTSLLLIALAKISVTDSTLLFFETLTVLSLFNFLHTRKTIYLLFFVLGIAGGTLTKGPPVLILTYGILGVLFLFRAYRLRTVLLFFISLIGLIPLFLWGKAVWNMDGGVFISWMVDWYILKRGEGVFGQTGPPGYFFVVFLVGLFAVSSFFLVGLKHHFTAFFQRTQRNPKSIFLVAWLMAGWLVYELITSKLPAYAIGAIPALSLVIADQIEHYSSHHANHKRWYAVTSVIQLVLTAALGMVFLFIAFSFYDGLPRIMAVLTGVLTLGLGIFVYRSAHKNMLVLATTALIPSLVTWTFLVTPLESKRCTTKMVAEYIATHVDSERPVVFTRNFSLPSLPFYLAVKGFAYSENQDFSTYPSYLAEGRLLIFDQDGFQVFLEQHGHLSEELAIHQIDGWIPDRGKQISYLIVEQKR